MPRRSPDRRVACRIAISMEAAYEDAEHQFFLETRDLSEAGVYLLAPDPPPAGGQALLLLDLPGSTPILRLPGVVARREGGTGFALHFDDEGLDPATRGALREFIEER